MKKLICCILAVALLLGVASAAYATEVTTCVVAADTVTASGAGEVAVPVRIVNNPGFTNFAITLDYDRQALTLVRVEGVAGDASGVNPQRKAPDGSVSAFVTSASAQAVTGDVVLFTAVFTVAQNFTGTTRVTPVVSYLRNNTALFSAFEEITATATAGSVEAKASVTLGDVNGDGSISAIDITMVRMNMKNKYTFSQAQLQAADVDGSGKITALDVTMISMRMKNKLSKFPGEK